MADAKPKPKPKDYDERIYRKGHPPHRIRNALILIGLVLIGTYLAVTKELPFGDKYEVRAVFENAANIRKDSPVRIAGVNVGKVQSVRSVGDAAEVTFSVDEGGQPLREDTLVEIRPRIFLEGNFFLDVKPGSPSAPEIDDGGTIPITQTSTAVQLDQILTTLQAPDRENLSKLLIGYGQALNRQPTAADDKGVDPDIQGESAAEAINDSFQYGADASRDSAIVNEALLGTSPDDLSKLINANASVFNALLSREEQLKDLITNFNTFSGALAAESENLGETIRLLAPTLENATPSLRNTNATLPVPAGVRPRHRAGHPRAAGHDRRLGPVAEADQGAAWPQRAAPARPSADADRPARRRRGRRLARPLQRDGAAQPLRLERPDPDGRRPDHRRLHTGQRAQLQGVRLRGHRVRGRDPELRRQRALYPLPDGRRQLRRRQRPGAACPSPAPACRPT